MRPRLCLATDSLEPSGVGEHMLALANGLRQRGFDLAVACAASEGGNALLRRADAEGIEGERLADDPDSTADWLARGGFDLLHIHAGIGWEGHGLSAQGRAAGIALIVRTEHLPALITDPEQMREHEEGIGRVDRIICVSEAAAATFRAAGVDPAQIAVVRNGMRFRPAAQSGSATRHAFGFHPGQPILLGVARFTAQKDHAALINALPEVLARCPDARLWLVGTGPLEGEVRAQVTQMGLDEAVAFLGHRDDVPDLMAAADVLVLSSRFEGLPLVVLEAMAAGLPVAATRAGGTGEAVVHGETGLLVEPGDAPALAAAIVDIAANPAVARAFGAAARVRYQTRFTAERMADETADVYAALGLRPDA